MGRQQLVLQDLAKQLDPVSLILQLPNLLQIAGDNFRTTFQPQDMGSLLQFAAGVDRSKLKEVLFVPPTYPEYLTKSEISRMQKVVRNVFPAVTASPAPSASIAPSATPSASAKTCGGS
jgi:hypothetical protein